MTKPAAITEKLDASSGQEALLCRKGIFSVLSRCGTKVCVMRLSRNQMVVKVRTAEGLSL